MKKLSIIVPVYNTEKFLPKCIDSLLHQKYLNTEIILVNDGSTDSSPQICDEYASKYKNIFVHHQNNSGPSIARNNGLTISTGEYIGYVDSDDFIEPNMYSTLIALLESNDLDIISCIDDNIPNYSPVSVEELPLIIKNTRQTVLDHLLDIDCSPTAKVFKRYVVEQVPFPPGLIYEDVGSAYLHASIISKSGFIQAPLYHAIVHPSSITRHSISTKKRHDYLVINKQRLDFAIEKDYPEAIPFLISKNINAALSLLTLLHATESSQKAVYNHPYYAELKAIIDEFSNHQDAIQLLRSKDKFLLKNFYRFPFLHRYYAHLSDIVRKWKYK